MAKAKNIAVGTASAYTSGDNTVLSVSGLGFTPTNVRIARVVGAEYCTLYNIGMTQYYYDSVFNTWSTGNLTIIYTTDGFTVTSPTGTLNLGILNGTYSYIAWEE